MKSFWLFAVSTFALASLAFAQPATTQSPTGNLEKLSSFRSTGTAEPNRSSKRVGAQTPFGEI
jgi:hypothetical protein